MVKKLWSDMAVGLAIQEGLMSLDDRVIDYLPEQCHKEIPENLQKLTLRDLLMLRSGYSEAQNRELFTTSEILAAPPKFAPGEELVYCKISCHLIAEMFVTISQ